MKRPCSPFYVPGGAEARAAVSESYWREQRRLTSDPAHRAARRAFEEAEKTMQKYVVKGRPPSVRTTARRIGMTDSEAAKVCAITTDAVLAYLRSIGTPEKQLKEAKRRGDRVMRSFGVRP